MIVRLFAVGLVAGILGLIATIISVLFLIIIHFVIPARKIELAKDFKYKHYL